MNRIVGLANGYDYPHGLRAFAKEAMVRGAAICEADIEFVEVEVPQGDGRLPEDFLQMVHCCPLLFEASGDPDLGEHHPAALVVRQIRQGLDLSTRRPTVEFEIPVGCDSEPVYRGCPDFHVTYVHGANRVNVESMGLMAFSSVSRDRDWAIFGTANWRQMTIRDLQDELNPVGVALACAMLLEHHGLINGAMAIRKAIRLVLHERTITHDLGPCMALSERERYIDGQWVNVVHSVHGRQMAHLILQKIAA